MSRPHALLLDLDGTLVDSEPIHRAGFERWFAHRGWALDREVASLFTGRRADDVFRTVDGPWSGGDPTEMFHEIVAMVPRDRLPDAVPGAVASIERALAAGIPLALVTSAGVRWADKALAALGGIDRFDVVVTRDDVTVGKPDPSGYALACERLGVDAGRALACEDAPQGVVAAVAAGVGHVVGVTTSFSQQVLRDSGAHATMRDLTGIPNLLGPDHLNETTPDPQATTSRE
ncbi:MAG TPA: HAD family phosphatase [Ornithinibacter sp.]|nr:HAD family phosphatase [Ornithinibacter sp.]